MNILAFDTTSGLSVAVLRDEKLLAKRACEEASKQSEMLILEVERTLEQAKISYQNLDLIAVTKGPGSFTATRIGIVTAQTMKLALQLPLIALTANEVLAFTYYRNSMGAIKEKISTTINAGMNEFFCADFIFENSLPKPLGDIVIRPAEEVSVDVQGKISAEFVALLAFEKMRNSAEISQDDAALYLRAPRIGA